MGLKENFNQALKEMLNKGGLVGSDLEKKAKSQSDLNSYLDNMAAADAAPTQTAADGAPERAPSDMNVRISGTDWSQPPNFEDRTSSVPYQTIRRPDAQEGNYDTYRQNDEMTVISKTR